MRTGDPLIPRKTVKRRKLCVNSGTCVRNFSIPAVFGPYNGTVVLCSRTNGFADGFAEGRTPIAKRPLPIPAHLGASRDRQEPYPSGAAIRRWPDAARCKPADSRQARTRIGRNAFPSFRGRRPVNIRTQESRLADPVPIASSDIREKARNSRISPFLTVQIPDLRG